MSAHDRVRQMLREARDLMREEYPEGGEELLMLVFRQLSIERDLEGPSPEESAWQARLH